MQRVVRIVIPHGHAGDERPVLSRDACAQLLTAPVIGMSVMEHGEYATRGALLDLSRWAANSLIASTFG